MVENVHFTMKAGIENIIFKLFTSNVSDIAAMGGTPLYALLTTSIPKNKVSHSFLIDAILNALNHYGLYLIGGDTTASFKDIFFSLTLIGKKNTHLLKRSGAQPGNILCLSRPTGLSLVALENELYDMHPSIKKYYNYTIKAEKELGKLLGKLDGITSCIDVSDGLGVDANHISEESNVKVVIEADKLPVDHLKEFNIDKLKYILTSGEEYALIFTVGQEHYLQIFDKIKCMLNREIHTIGYIEEGIGTYLKTGKEFIDISKYGYIHEI
jgi:thiamine-monophosphate kinase